VCCVVLYLLWKLCYVHEVSTCLLCVPPACCAYHHRETTTYREVPSTHLMLHESVASHFFSNSFKARGGCCCFPWSLLSPAALPWGSGPWTPTLDPYPVLAVIFFYFSQALCPGFSGLALELKTSPHTLLLVLNLTSPPLWNRPTCQVSDQVRLCVIPRSGTIDKYV
jgi:hypothetical protein